MAVVVHQVVGQLELVEGDHVLHPLAAALWRVRMHGYAARQVRIGFAGDHPTRTS